MFPLTQLTSQKSFGRTYLRPKPPLATNPGSRTTFFDFLPLPY